MGNKGSNRGKIKHKTAHYLFLNHYKEIAFTKCPKCDTKTLQRKFPLVVHVEPNYMRIINKICKYCKICDLVIVKKDVLESMLQEIIPQNIKLKNEESYSIVGTLERQDWIKVTKGNLPQNVIAEKTIIFKNKWNFEITGGWVKEEMSERGDR